MLEIVPAILERGRMTTGPAASDASYGLNGMFHVDGPCGQILRIIASGAKPFETQSMGWEHVSVSLRKRMPNWQEMCFVKDLFWHPEETVLQYHPPKSQYVNYHPFCLHMWREMGVTIKLPPSIMIGPLHDQRIAEGALEGQ